MQYTNEIFESWIQLIVFDGHGHDTYSGQVYSTRWNPMDKIFHLINLKM